MLAVLLSAAVMDCGGTPVSKKASASPGSSLSTAVPGAAVTLAGFARRYAQRMGDASVRDVIVVPTTLARAKPVFGLVFSRPTKIKDTWAMLFEGRFAFPRPGSGETVRYLAVELVRPSLRVLAVVGSNKPPDLAPLGTEYRLVLE